MLSASFQIRMSVSPMIVHTCPIFARCWRATLALGFIAAVPAGPAEGASPHGESPGPQRQIVDLINADRPGIADGTGTLSRGRFQVEFGIQRESKTDEVGRSSMAFLPALIRVGLGRRAEFRVETNGYAWAKIEGADVAQRSSGWWPISLGMKYRLCADRCPVPIAIVGRAVPASGSSAFKSGRPTGDVRLAAELELTPNWSLNPNIGVAWYEGDEARFSATLLASTLTFTRSQRVMPFLDVGYQKPSSPAGPAALVVDAGLAYIVTPNVQFDASAGRGMHGPAAPFVAAGISVRRR